MLLRVFLRPPDIRSYSGTQTGLYYRVDHSDMRLGFEIAATKVKYMYTRVYGAYNTRISVLFYTSVIMSF